jgi:uncharacterized pyridoxamine 5'-phosphate oxidase family protein
MTVSQPVVERPLAPSDGPLPSWSDAVQHLATTKSFWLTTVRPDGGPHVMPIVAVLVEDSLYFCAAPASRKARNLAHDPRCAITSSDGPFELVIEGTAERERSAPTLEKAVAAYAEKYGWIVTVRDGALDGEGVPTAGPAPYWLYKLQPTLAFGFAAGGTAGAMRWQFDIA